MAAYLANPFFFLVFKYGSSWSQKSDTIFFHFKANFLLVFTVWNDVSLTSKLIWYSWVCYQSWLGEPLKESTEFKILLKVALALCSTTITSKGEFFNFPRAFTTYSMQQHSVTRRSQVPYVRATLTTYTEAFLKITSHKWISHSQGTCFTSSSYNCSECTIIFGFFR